MLSIRSLRRDDIPQIAGLHARVFPAASRLPAKDREPYFIRIFLDNPWYDEEIPPLVCEEDGKILGFLGVLPRRMLMNGQAVRVAVSSQFIVEQGKRAALVGAALLKRFFAGAQDLSMTDGGSAHLRKLWEALGGVTSTLYSLHWVRILRPSQYLLSLACSYRPLYPLVLLKPLGMLTDTIVAHLPRSPFRLRRQIPERDLGVDELLTWIRQASCDRLLRPQYDEHSLPWVLKNAEEKFPTGRLRRVAVHTEAGAKIGWYLYYVRPGGVSQVVQVEAQPDAVRAVLDHLFYHAWRHGSVAVSGRLEPQYADALWERKCLLGFFGPWFLFQSRRPEILNAIHRADAFLTRLDGEWWMPFFSF